jgi:hypothetical protein
MINEQLKNINVVNLMNLIFNFCKKTPKSSKFDPIIHEFAQLVITTSFIYKTHERKKLSIGCS